MSRGRTNSHLGIAARREKAKELFARGWTNVEVAREVGVSAGTAARYRDMYNADIKKQADSNPQLLQDVLVNTFGALAEINQVRQEAWRQYQECKQPSQKATFLNTALKAGAERNKVLQLFGVKAEYMEYVNRINRQQERLINWLAEGEFCDHDRERIGDFIATMTTFNEIDSLPTTASVDS